jgi:hypothetical protein
MEVAMMTALVAGRWYWAAQQPRKLLDLSGWCITIDGWTATLASHKFEPLTEAGYVSFLRGPIWIYQRSPCTTVEIREARVAEIWDQLAGCNPPVPEPDPDWQREVWRRIDGPWWKRAWRWLVGGWR